MVRPWRIQFSDAVYHVMSRGNAGSDIFLDDDDLRFFLELLGRFSGRFNVQIFSFCLMSNHYHLFLRTREPNLSDAMRWLNSSYSGRFNRLHRRHGHVLQGRYKSVLVDEEAYWFRLSAYIHLNPVRAGIVFVPEEYEWSSCRDYTRPHSRFKWLDSGPVLAPYGTGDAAKFEYRRQLMALAGKPALFWDDIRNSVFLGSHERWQRLREEHRGGDASKVYSYGARIGGPVDFYEELSRVALALGIREDDILSGRRKSHCRPALYYHLVENCGMSCRRVAEFMGVSVVAVSLGARRARELMDKDADFRAKLLQ